MLRSLCLALLVVALAETARGQDASPGDFYIQAEVMPEPIGGLAGIFERVAYPDEARRDGASGTVILSAMVEPDGTVSRVEVLRGVHDLLDAEARRVLLETRFKPGMQGGERVRVRMNLPIRFALLDPPLGTEPHALPKPVAPVFSEPDEEAPTIYDMPDEPPRLIGGMAGFIERLRYPREARRARAEGLIMIRFVVTPSGIPLGLEVVQGGHSALEAEALRAVSGARFAPARVDGTPVYARFSMPVLFRLSSP